MCLLSKKEYAENTNSSSWIHNIECRNIDFIGPFPDKGYILVIVCTFTRWLELYGTADATALSTASVASAHHVS